MAYSLRMGTSNTSRRSRCWSMDGRRCLQESPSITANITNKIQNKSQLKGQNTLAQGHEALLNDVSLGLREGSSTRQTIDCVQHGVNHYGSVVTAGEQRGALSDEWQHSRTQVAVQSQGHLRGAESNLLDRNSEVGYRGLFEIREEPTVWELFILLCPGRQQPSCQAKSPLPARATGNPGCQCHTLCPGTEPWGPCDLARNWQTSLVLWCCYLLMRRKDVERRMDVGQELNKWLIKERNEKKKCWPFPNEGIWTGRLMTPTRSSIGTRDLRIARILRASPFPAWINCQEFYRSTFFNKIVSLWASPVQLQLKSLRASLEHSDPAGQWEQSRKTWWHFPGGPCCLLAAPLHQTYRWTYGLTVKRLWNIWFI